MVDYLNARLFEPLHIVKPKWEESPQGINTGGWGLYLKTEDLAKMGQLLLQKGEWNGKQLIPAEWVAEMSKKQVESINPGTRMEEAEAKGVYRISSPARSITLPTFLKPNIHPLLECVCKGSIFFRYYQIYLGKSCLEATFYSKESLFRRFFSCSASDLRMDSLISQVLS